MLETVGTTDPRITDYWDVILFAPHDSGCEIMRWRRFPNGKLQVTITAEMEEAAKGFWELVRHYSPPGARLEVGDMNEPPP